MDHQQAFEGKPAYDRHAALEHASVWSWRREYMGLNAALQQASPAGEAVFLVKVDDVFFFDFFEDGWHGMKDGGISHPTDLTSLRQWCRLSLTIGICARMKLVSGFLQIR